MKAEHEAFKQVKNYRFEWLHLECENVIHHQIRSRRMERRIRFSLFFFAFLEDDFEKQKSSSFFIKMTQNDRHDCDGKVVECGWREKKNSIQRKILKSNDKYWFYCYICEQAKKKKLSKKDFFFLGGASLNPHKHTFLHKCAEYIWDLFVERGCFWAYRIKDGWLGNINDIHKIYWIM